jgi:hypothetical protein
MTQVGSQQALKLRLDQRIQIARFFRPNVEIGMLPDGTMYSLIEPDDCYNSGRLTLPQPADPTTALPFAITACGGQ